VLPQFFKSGSIASFVRSLNFYGFRCVARTGRRGGDAAAAGDTSQASEFLSHARGARAAGGHGANGSG
jgi:hypothetical protein